MTRGLRRGRPVLAAAAVLWLSVGAVDGSATQGVQVTQDVQVTQSLTEIDAYLARSREEHGWPGLAVAIVADGEVAWSAGYGSTGRDGEAVTARTPFLLASVSKSLTAVSMMRLVDSGDLGLQDPVSEHLPELSPGGEDVTVADLMFQHSGLGRGADNAVFGADERATVADNARTYEPMLRADAEFAYSNANYDLLALLVERVSGVPFADYLEREVFAPLDMATATTDPEAARKTGLAAGHYHWLGLGFRPFDPPLPDYDVGSYRMFASAEDVAHSLVMHLSAGEYDGRRVLSPESVSVLQTGEPVGGGDHANYGGGLWVHPPGSPWMTGPSAAYSFLEHDGSALSYRSYIWLMPDLGLGMVLLANANDWSDESRLPQVGFNVRQMLLDEEVSPVTNRSPAAVRWGKHLFAAVALAQLTLTVAAIRPTVSIWHGRRPGRGGVALLLAALATGLFTAYALARLIPSLAQAPLWQVADAPDARILLSVMIAGLALGAVLAVASMLGLLRVLSRARQRPATTGSSRTGAGADGTSPA